jgi:2C-methyl-D-erythritol 2,4-cyclodiphosphate synthase
MAAIQQRVAVLLGVTRDQVGIKAKTMEGLGAIGAGEAICAMAVAILAVRPRPRRSHNDR